MYLTQIFHYQGMFEPRMIVNKGARSERISMIVKYFRDNRGQHTFYCLRFIMCEFLNFANVIGQMFLMDKYYKILLTFTLTEPF